jgi:hypothetical protein
VNGTCPSSFDIPSAGVVLSAPARACDFSVTLGDEPDFFVTSQAPGACQKNLKMHVHTVCVQNTAASASSALAASGVGAMGTWSSRTGAAGVGSNVITNGRLSTLGSRMTPGMTADGAYTQLPPGMIGEQQDQFAMEAGKPNAAGVQGVSMVSIAGAALAAVAAVCAL